MVPLGCSLILSFFSDNLYFNIGLLVILVLLLLASAFFSSVETAYSSVNIIRLRNYMEEKKPGAKKAVYIAEKFDFTLTTILIGNNFVDVAATTISAYLLTNMIVNPTLSNIVSMIVMTTLILIFGEIIPKQYAKENPEKVALRYASFLFLIIKILWPITWLYVKLKKSVFRNKELTSSPHITEEELESIIDVMETEGIINETDADLIQSAIALNERTVYDIMTPRVDIIAVEATMPIEEIKEVFFENQFSRVPVYRDDKDNMIGILSEKDFFTALLKNQEIDIDIEKLISEPYYVSKATKVNDLIKEMQKLKKHFAIVADEYGGTSGIVTMEDALEELVGEIYDEYDEEDAADITKIGENKYLLSTEMELEDLFEELKLGEVPETQFTSVGGFIYGLCDGLPFEGKVIHFPSTYEEHSFENSIIINYDLQFTIKKVENRRIRSIELIVNQVEELEK